MADDDRLAERASAGSAFGDVWAAAGTGTGGVRHGVTPHEYDSLPGLMLVTSAEPHFVHRGARVRDRRNVRLNYPPASAWQGGSLAHISAVVPTLRGPGSLRESRWRPQ